MEKVKNCKKIVKVIIQKYAWRMIFIYLFAANLLVPASEAQTRFGVERLRTGIGAYERGEYDVAVFRLELALDRFSDEEREYLWTVRLYLGLSHYLLGERDEAVKEFVRANEIIGQKRPDPDLYSPKVVRLFKEALAEKARLVKPEKPGVMELEAGIGAYEDGRYNDAKVSIEAALGELPQKDKENLWEAHLYLGLTNLLMGKEAEARNVFIKAQGIMKNKTPDLLMHSPKVVVLYKGASEPEITGVWKDPKTGMEFVFVKGGCYKMGDTFGDGFEEEKPVHEVCVDGFYMGKYEITQGQWEKVMGSNPSRFSKGNDYPVEDVSWNDIQEFIKKLNRKTGKSYRLPTEAEWEYAARSGGKREKFAGFSSENELYRYANFCDTNCEYRWKSTGQDDGYENTSSVGNFSPNGLGLYDMSGNVREWCSAWYSSDYYSDSLRKNPQGPASGSYRVIRGGSWNDFAGNCRSSGRHYYDPSYAYYFLGFRLVLPQAIR